MRTGPVCHTGPFSFCATFKGHRPERTAEQKAGLIAQAGLVFLTFNGRGDRI
jgi:hypothetical protein